MQEDVLGQRLQLIRSRALLAIALAASFGGCRCGRSSGDPTPTVAVDAASFSMTVEEDARSPEQANARGAAKATAGIQTCLAGQTCDWACPAGSDKCVQTCTNKSTCTGSCAAGGCKQVCAQTATCTFTCEGGGCIQSCAGLNCNKSCTGGTCR